MKQLKIKKIYKFQIQSVNYTAKYTEKTKNQLFTNQQKKIADT